MTFDTSQVGVVSGRVVRLDGKAAAGVKVVLIPEPIARRPGVKACMDGSTPPSHCAFARAADDGSFRFPAVAPGKYVVQVPLPDGHEPPEDIEVKAGAQVTLMMTARQFIVGAPPLRSGRPPGRAGGAGFGPSIERSLNRSGNKRRYLDLDTGRLFGVPDSIPESMPGPARRARLKTWAKKHGVDLCAADILWGFQMVVLPGVRGDWDEVPAPGLLRVMAGKPLQTPAAMPPRTSLPTTYLFRTREGGIGVLQIVGFTEKHRGYKIRYKMLKLPKPGKTAPAPHSGLR